MTTLSPFAAGQFEAAKTAGMPLLPGMNLKGLRPSVLLQHHRQAILQILQKYPKLSNLRVFGSVARGTDTVCSDIDFLVDAAAGTTLFELGGFLEDVHDVLGIPVDVITSGDSMDREMKSAILQEAFPL